MQKFNRFISFLLGLLIVLSLGLESFSESELSMSDINAQSAILVEASSGKVIFEKNADSIRFPASTTKIITVLLGIQAAGENIDNNVVASYSSTQIPEDASRISLQEGQEIKLRDLLTATLVGSGNDGANLIAELVSGNNSAFAEVMTQSARAMGAQSTNFTNPSGLHDEFQVTTARDLATIARVAMSDPTFKAMAKLSHFRIPKNNMNNGKQVSSRDKLFKQQSENEDEQQYYMPDSVGVKTGYTSQAGYCYVAAAERNGLMLISVALKADSYGKAFLDSKKMLEYGFTQYVSTSITELYKKSPRVIDIASFSENDPELGRLSLNITKKDPNANDRISDFASNNSEIQRIFKDSTTFQLDYEKLKAPIEAGDEMGTMYYKTPNGETIEYSLTASRSVAARERKYPTIEEIKEELSRNLPIFPRFKLGYLIILALALLVIFAALKLIRAMFRLIFRKN